jgi:hypothetical protein
MSCDRQVIDEDDRSAFVAGAEAGAVIGKAKRMRP